MISPFRKNIEAIIKERHLTIAALERMAGLNRNSIQNILRGVTKNPSVKTLKAIADALGWELIDLVGDERNDDHSQKLHSVEHSLSVIDISSLELKTLFKKTIAFSADYIAQQTSHIKLEEFSQVTHSIFNYCKDKNEANFDIKFAEWILEQHFKSH